MSGRRTALLRFAAWTGSAWLLGFPAIGRIGTDLVGDPGDAMFHLAILRWGETSAHSGFSGFWAGQIFHTAHLPMAYSDTHLGLAPIFALLNALVGPVASMNLIYLALFVVALESSWRLCLRISGHPLASVVGALVFTYSTIRLGQANHFQLMVGALLPLIALMVLRLTDDDPRWHHGVALGLSLAVLTLSASYLGIAAVLLVGGLLIARLPRIRSAPRSILPRIALAAVIAGVLVGPIALRYLELQDDPYFTRDPSTAQGTSLAGLGRSQQSMAVVESPTPGRRPYSEDMAFPGIIGVVFGLVGLGCVVRRRWWESSGLDPRRRSEAAALAIIGLVLAVISVGNNALFDVAVQAVPGFSGIRALVRLIVVGQLGIAILAGIGVAALAKVAARSERTTATACVLLGVLVCVESTLQLSFARTPLDQHEFLSINRRLAELPPGIVLELPAKPPSSGVFWGFVEAPRMVAAGEDGNVRVNGYSGFFPKWYEADIAAANDPSSSDGQAVLINRDVRYLVFRTTAYVSGDAGYDRLISPVGTSWMSAPEAAREISKLPPTEIEHVDSTSGGIIVTLR